MKRCFIELLGVALIFGAVSASRGQDGQAGMPGAYLHMGVGARALGMGGAYSSVASDVTAIYWNPAGLAVQDPVQLYFMHSTLFVDSALDFFAASVPTRSFGSFGLGMLALTSGDFEQRTALNEVVGNFNTRDLAFLLSWAKEVTPGISVGLNYKLVNQKILEYSGTGHGLDLGVKAHLFDKLDAGLVFANLLSPKVKLSQDAESFPLQIRAGVSSRVVNEQLLLSVEMSKTSGWGGAQLHFGTEYNLMNNLALRAGVDQSSFTFGAGFSFNTFDVGYSNRQQAELGANHRFALKYTFGGFGVSADATPRIFSPSGEKNITRIKFGVRSRKDIEGWHFEILNSEGKIIREFTTEGHPPEEIVWDGRDGDGALVLDGHFSYRFAVNTVDGKQLTSEGGLVTIDTQGPSGFISSGDDE